MNQIFTIYYSLTHNIGHVGRYYYDISYATADVREKVYLPVIYPDKCTKISISGPRYIHVNQYISAYNYTIYIIDTCRVCMSNI